MVASKVFIARHGERIDHVDDTWKESVDNTDDPFLTERGLAQAACLGRRLANEDITKIFVSPFYRTIQTAAAVSNATGAQLYIEPGMCEALLPQWFRAQPRLTSLTELSCEFPSIVTDYSPVHTSIYPETKQSCAVRVFKTARALAIQETGNILFVGHGITCDYATQALLKVNRVANIDYCGLIECVWNNNADGSGMPSYCYGEQNGPTTDYIDAEVRPRGAIKF